MSEKETHRHYHFKYSCKFAATLRLCFEKSLYASYVCPCPKMKLIDIVIYILVYLKPKLLSDSSLFMETLTSTFSVHKKYKYCLASNITVYCNFEESMPSVPILRFFDRFLFTRYIPSKDLYNIYKEYYGKIEVPQIVIEACAELLYLEWIGEKLAGAKLFPMFAKKSPFLTEQLHDYFLGKLLV